MHIVVGGGRVGRRIAEMLNDCIIVEKSREQYESLKDSGLNVVLGDATQRELWERLPVKDSVIILATNNDLVNLKIAKVVRDFEPRDMVARIESEVYQKQYQNLGVRGVTCGKSIASDLIHELIESKRRYFEIAVSKNNFADVRLSDLNVGDDCTIILIYREGKIFRPHPDFILEEGDVIGIICGREVKKTKNPFDEILLVIRHPENYDEVLKEANSISRIVDADLLILHKHDGKILCSFQADSIEEMELSEALEILNTLEDKVDLVMTDPPKAKVEFDPKIFRKFPILFARGKTYYSEILAIVNTSNPEEILNYATSFANYFGRCKIVFLDSNQLKTSSFVVESPTVEITVTKFNPLVEIVREVKREYDLLIFSISNDIGNLDQEFLWKFILETRSSVLVVR